MPNAIGNRTRPTNSAKAGSRNSVRVSQARRRGRPTGDPEPRDIDEDVAGRAGVRTSVAIPSYWLLAVLAMALATASGVALPATSSVTLSLTCWPTAGG